MGATPEKSSLPLVQKSCKYKSVDYTLRKEKLQEALGALDVPPPQVDAFASPENTRCPLYWDVNNSAFKRNWKAQGLLWINPPFDQLEEAVNKIETDQAKCLFLCPNWPNAPWWKKINRLAKRMHFSSLWKSPL